MIPLLRAESRKIMTVRSTYFILVISLVILVFFAGYSTGYRIDPSDLLNPTYLSSQITGAFSFLTFLIALIGLLSFGHEYRYSTIIYTLTASKSRAKILTAKILVITGLAIAFSVLVGILTPAITLAGISLHHYHLISQSIDYGKLWWTCLFYVWGYCMLALIMIALIRNQIGAIITFLLFPTTVEGILTLWLNGNTKYLPFTALGQVLGGEGRLPTGSTNIHTEVLVVLAYIIVGWLVAFVLFARRDAN
jgi:ABC-2 type transport system permease protein